MGRGIFHSDCDGVSPHIYWDTGGGGICMYFSFFYWWCVCVFGFILTGFSLANTRILK